MPTSIRNHSIHGPFSITQAISGDFKPLQTSGSSRGSIIHLGKIVLYRTYDVSISFCCLYDHNSSR
jgi:hypothetical protein